MGITMVVPTQPLDRFMGLCSCEVSFTLVVQEDKDMSLVTNFNIEQIGAELLSKPFDGGCINGI